MTTLLVSYTVLTDGVVTGGGTATATEDGQALVRQGDELVFQPIDGVGSGFTGTVPE